MKNPITIFFTILAVSGITLSSNSQNTLSVSPPTPTNLEKEVAELKQKYKDLEVNLTELRKKNKAAESKIEEKDITIKELNSQLSTKIIAEKTLNDSVTTLGKMIKGLKDQDLAKELRLARLASEITNQKVEINGLKEQLVSHLQQSSAEIEAKKNELAAEKSRLAEEKRLKDSAYNKLKMISNKIRGIIKDKDNLLTEKLKSEEENRTLLDSLVNLRAENDKISFEIGVERERSKKLQASTDIYRWSILVAVGLLLLGLLYPLYQVFVRMRFAANDQKLIDNERDRFMKDTLTHYFYLKRTTELLRRTLIMLIAITTAFVFFQTSWITFADDNLNFSALLDENFWKMVGGITLPLGLVITLYNNAESKKNEISQFLIELNSDRDLKAISQSGAKSGALSSAGN